MRARTMAIARGEHRPAEGEPTVRFTSIESIARMPSRHNRELPALILNEHPDWLTGPAALGGRQQVESVTDAEDYVAPRVVERERGRRGPPVPRVPRSPRV